MNPCPDMEPLLNGLLDDELNRLAVCPDHRAPCALRTLYISLPRAATA